MSDKTMVHADDRFRTTLTLNYPRPPLNLNQRMHWRHRDNWSRVLRQQVAAMARDIPFMEHIAVTLIWVVKDRRKRDADNPVPTLKALCDGLVDADIVAEDTPQFMTKHMPVIEYRAGAKPHLELVIEEVRG